MDKTLEKIMHNLRPFGADGNKRLSQTLAPMSEQIVIQHLKHCRDLSRAFASKVFPGFWRQWCQQLLDNANHAKSTRDQVSLLEAQGLIVAVQNAAEQDFCQHLSNGFVKFKNKTLMTLTGEERFMGDILSLVEQSDLEETIAITSITRRAENYYSDKLWSIQQRMALLNDGDKLDERSNPISPVQFCEALRKVLSSIGMDAKTKLIGYKIFNLEVIDQLDGLYDEVNAYLIERNFLPNLRFASIETAVPVDNRVEHHALENNSVDDISELDKEPNIERGVEKTASLARDRVSSDASDSGDVRYQDSLLDAIKLLQPNAAEQNGSIAPAIADVDATNAEVPSINKMPVNEVPINEVPINEVSINELPMNEAPSIDIDASSAALSAPVMAADFAAIRVLKHPVKSSTTEQPLRVFTGKKLVKVLDAFQSLSLPATRTAFQNTHKVALPPQDIQKLKARFLQHIAGAAVEPSDIQTIDVIGMLFEYMLAEEYLSDSVKALLSYLYIPLLKIALIDKNFIKQPDHAARVLLNNMVEAGIRWVNKDGLDQFEMFPTIKSTVFRALENSQNDGKIFTELLAEFHAYTTNVSRRQELMENRALEKAKGEEKLREAKLHVNRAVRSCTNGREMPSAILLLLFQPWSDYLSFLVLRYGQHSESWAHAIRVIDDLLWTLEPKTLQLDKELHLQKQVVVIQSLEHGFETIGYEQTKGRKLIQAVITMQKMALQSRVAEPAPALMRAKLEAIAAEKAGDLGELSHPQNADEIRMFGTLKATQLGTWFELAGGKRFKAVWFNQKTQHYMMMDQQGKRVSLIAGLSLARKMMIGEARIIPASSKPFVDRALDNIYQSLSERAQISSIAAQTSSPASDSLLNTSRSDSAKSDLSLPGSTRPGPTRPGPTRPDSSHSVAS